MFKLRQSCCGYTARNVHEVDVFVWLVVFRFSRLEGGRVGGGMEEEKEEEEG